MLRTIHPHLILFVTKCQLQQRTMKILIQSTRTMTVTPIVQKVSHPNIDNTPNLKAIIEEAESCGISSNHIKSVLDSNPDLLKYSPKQWSYVLKMLLGCGLDVENVLKVISKCPKIFELEKGKLTSILEALYNYNFGKNGLSLLSCLSKLSPAEKLNKLEHIIKLIPYFEEGRNRADKAIAGIFDRKLDENQLKILRMLIILIIQILFFT